MEEEEDRGEWLASAASSPVLVAHELICLRNPWKRVPWRRLVRPPPPAGEAAPSDVRILEEEIGFPASPELAAPPAWGVRRPRTRKSEGICGGLGAAKEEEDDETAARGRERASPATPLDFSAGSGGSVSGGEEGSSAAAAAAAGGPTPSELRGGTKVVSRERAPLEYRIPVSRPIRRPGKKKTIPELQAVEKSLLEERRLLQREVESRRTAREGLVEENQRLKRLKLSMLSKSVPPAMTAVSAETEPTEAHQMQGRSDFIALPDLNEPCLEA